MKRCIIIIIIFAIVSVSCTAILIQITNNTKKNETQTEVVADNNVELQNNVIDLINSNNIIEVPTVIQNNTNEKTLDLYGTHSENDILYETKKMIIYGEEIPYIQISGLKNKNVETKINDTIKKKIMNKFKEFVNEKVLTDCYFYCDMESNFANTISISFYFSGKDENEYINGHGGLNFELINGEEIKFEDIFKTGEDLSIFPRMGLYRYLAEISKGVGEGPWYDNVHYDINKQEWVADYHLYDENSTEHVEEGLYIPQMTEYEIEKMVKKFIKSEEKEFYYTPSGIYMKIDDYLYYVNFYDIPEKVVIYDKYLTDEDLYENHNIGVKSIINCSAERNYGKYKETKYETNNFFYDMDGRLTIEPLAVDTLFDEKIAVNYLNNRLKEETNRLKEEIQKYREIALNNPNKAYFVFLETNLYNGGRHSNQANNLIQVTKNVRIVECDIKDKKEILDKILDGYRYYNIGFYGSIYGYFNVHGIIKDEYGNDITDEIPATINEISEIKYYNMLNGKEIKAIQDIFIDGVDYENILKQYITYNNAQNVQYKFDIEEITINYNTHNVKYIKYSELKPYVVVRELKPYILEESSTRKYNKPELENLTIDELNIAYNEPFARYGHDFKTKSLKDYFSNWDWYKPVSGKTVGLESLNEIEKYNVELIKTVINEKQ